MLVGQQGYVPEPYFLTETLRSQTRFHDPYQDSLFSNAGSVQGFRDWSTGRSSPQPLSADGASPTVDTSHGRNLAVRSCRPIGHSAALDANLNQRSLRQQPKCRRIAEDVYEAHLPSLVTPKSKVPGTNKHKSIRYAILEVRSIFICLLIHASRITSGTLCWTAVIWTSMVKS